MTILPLYKDSLLVSLFWRQKQPLRDHFSRLIYGHKGSWCVIDRRLRVISLRFRAVMECKPFTVFCLERGGERLLAKDGATGQRKRHFAVSPLLVTTLRTLALNYECTSDVLQQSQNESNAPKLFPSEQLHK